MSPLIQKIKIGTLLSVFIFTSVFGFLASVRPAQAQMVTSDVNAGSQLALDQVKDVKLTIKEKAVMLMMQAVMSGLNYFMNKIAYDSAVYLASGGKGQKPFAHKDGPAGYLRNVAGDALGEALGQLSKGLGFNLCDLPDPRLDLAFKLSLHLQYTEPKPECSWQQLKTAYSAQNIRSKYFSQEGTFGRIAVSLDVEGSDFGAWMDAKYKVDQHAEEAKKGAEIERNEGNGFKAMTDLITGEVKTPASVIEQEFKAAAPSQQKDSQSATMGPALGAAMQKGAMSVVYQTAGTFINTLLGTMLKNFTTKGMLPGGAKLCNPGLSLTGITLEPCADTESSSLAANYYSSGIETTSNRRLAQEMFNDLLVPKIKTVDNFEVLSNLANCSEEDKNPYSCLVDQAFLQILQSAESGKPMTIREALENNFLHGDWKILSSKDSLNSKWNCAEEQVYCYRNIQVLRKLRVLPLGLEIAASVMENSEQSLTLKELTDKFLEGSASTNPYYKLVNPNWIIKLPKMRCNAQAPGTIVQNGARYEECVDLQHCVAYNKDGSCSSYGYCMEEDQRWLFGSDYCDWQNDTCTSFTDNETGDNVSYLSRTVDNRFCDENNVGCRRYSTIKFISKDNNDVVTSNWATKEKLDLMELAFATRVTHDTNPNDNNPIWVNTGINLNSKTQTCESGTDGCSAFKLASDTSKTLYLKKAPDYLGCYDSEMLIGENRYIWNMQATKMITGVQWPQTLSDLNRIQPQDPEACKKYAAVCLPEEAGCNYYTIANTGEKVPGKFKPAELIGNEIVWNNQCDKNCVGYDAFRQMPSAYSNGKTADYIIPSSGQTCAASEAGCTSFTNLSETAGDFEKVEYFSYLRACIPPDQTKQKTFYSYERNESGDLRLTTFVLEADASGNPKMLYRDLADYAATVNTCNEAKYLAGTSDANCRRLYDDSTGNNNYRYVDISKTILVSDECTPYRLNETEKFTSGSFTHCPYEFTVTGNTVGMTDSMAVQEKNGSCYYYGMPSGSTGGAGDTLACTKEVDSCRAYKGNAGNNYRIVLDDSFESYNNTDEMDNVWSPLLANMEWSSESTNAVGHSLKVDPNTANQESMLARKIQLTSEKSYNISFWARGGGVVASITLRNSAGSEYEAMVEPINMTDVWHYYTFGPIDYRGDTDTNGSVVISIMGGDGARDVVYIDNIKITENTDYLYLVRNSLKVDPVCDSNTADNLPGEALGCREYRDNNKNTYYLTGFSYLCREDAIGCTGLLDTFNTLDTEEEKYYNIWVAGNADTYGEVSVTVGTKSYSCFAERGQNGCYINTVGNTAAEIYANASLMFTSSTQYFPADTSTSTPVYLVVNEKAVCRSENLGCQAVGLVTEDYTGESFTEVTIKNDPALYDSTLCSDQSIGCKSYSANGGTFYFKDPKITGGRLCEWRNESSFYGWYIQGTDDPCYDDYTFNSPFDNVASGVRGLRSNGHSLYNGSVGLCSEDQNGCSEFADPVGTSNSNVYKRCAKTNVRCYVDSDCEEEGDTCISNSATQSYFLLDNDALREGVKDCNGMVSVHEGCVLFDKTSVPDKYWDAYDSYASTGVLREPVSSNSNDTNVILKVERDRECTAWAFCSDYQQVDQDVRRCHRLGVCSEAGTAAGSNVAVAACQNVITEDWQASGRILDLDLFRSRSVGRATAEEYSGYAMYNRFPITDYTPRSLPTKYFDQDNGSATDRADILVVSQESNDCTSATDESGNVSCTADNGDGSGTCFRGECVMDVTGQPLNIRQPANESTKTTCRAYPETESPFDVSVFNKASERDLEGYRPGYDNVKVCAGNETDKESCDCDYVKYKTSVGDVSLSHDWVKEPKSLAYGEEEKCLDELSLEKRDEMCAGGKYDGYYCDSMAKEHLCVEDSNKESEDLCSKYGGICSQIKGKSTMSGWRGYCMEDDVRYKINGRNDQYHCLTWWPVESVANDFWLLDDSAAYQAGDVRNRYMCLASETALNNFDLSGNDGLLVQRAGSSDTAKTTASEYYLSYNNSGNIAYPKNISVNNNGFSFTVSYLPGNAMIVPNISGDEASPSYYWGYRVNPTNRSVSVFNAFLDRKINKFLVDYKSGSSSFDPNNPYWNNLTNDSWKHADAFLKSEVEELDVIIDDDSRMEVGDNGYISFINRYNNQPYEFPYGGSGENPNEQVCDTSAGECCLKDLGGNDIFCAKYQADFGNTNVLKKVKVSQKIIDCAPYGSTKKWGSWEFSMVGNTDNADTEKIPRAGDFDQGNEFLASLCANEVSSNGTTHYHSAVTSRGTAYGVGARVLFEYGVDGNPGTPDDIMIASWLTFKENDHTPRNGVFYIIHQSGGSCAQYAQVSQDVASLTNFSFKPVTWRLLQDKVGLQDMYADDGFQINRKFMYSLVTRSKTLDGANEYGLMRSVNPLWSMTGSRYVGPLTNPFMPIGILLEGRIKERNYSDDQSLFASYSGYEGGVPLVSLDHAEIPFQDWYSYGVDDDFETRDYNSGYLNFDFATNGEVPCVSTSATDTPYCQMLKKMYVKVSGGSNRVAAYDASKPDNAARIGLSIYPPHIAAPTGEVASKLRMDAFSVNGITRGNVVLTGSGDEASIQFYAWADPNQMPLRRLAVLSGMSGDPALVSQEVSIGNHKATCKGEKYCYYGASRSNTAHWQLGCETDADCGYYTAGGTTITTGLCLDPQERINPEGFGNGEDTGCKNEPFEYVISYNCTAADVDGNASDFLTGDELNFWNISGSTDVCVFQPRVQVLDNWGWCSGTCSASGYTVNGDPRKFTLSSNYGCFDAGSGSSLRECHIENVDSARDTGAWTTFNGNVIVPVE